MTHFKATTSSNFKADEFARARGTSLRMAAFPEPDSHFPVNLRGDFRCSKVCSNAANSGRLLASRGDRF